MHTVSGECLVRMHIPFFYLITGISDRIWITRIEETLYTLIPKVHNLTVSVKDDLKQKHLVTLSCWCLTARSTAIK